MPRLSLELRRLIVTLCQNGSSVKDTCTCISCWLSDGRVIVSHTSLYKLLKKYKKKRTLGDLSRATVVPMLNEEHLVFIDIAIAENDETTSTKLLELLTDKWLTLQVSKPTIKRARKKLGWVETRPNYCQL
uniref:Transposase Tc1-like domain-containing protein n=1 Tax=Amphimedon queenslandica TaxID=400682 RepID=A0A1X7TWK9_AMPQE